MLAAPCVWNLFSVNEKRKPTGCPHGASFKATRFMLATKRNINLPSRNSAVKENSAIGDEQDSQRRQGKQRALSGSTSRNHLSPGTLCLEARRFLPRRCWLMVFQKREWDPPSGLFSSENLHGGALVAFMASSLNCAERRGLAVSSTRGHADSRGSLLAPGAG